MRTVESEERRMPLPLLMERILAVMTLLAYACLIVGFPSFIIGRSSNNLVLSQVGAYILIVGVGLLAMRIFYWILEEIVGRGLESMTPTESVPVKVGLIV